jgi:hypothetical protein
MYQTPSAYQNPQIEFAIIFSEGDQLKSLFQYIDISETVGTLSISSAGVSYEGNSLRYWNYIKFQLYSNQLIEFNYNTALLDSIDSTTLPEDQYDRTEKVRKVNFNYEYLASLIGTIGKNEVELIKYLGINEIILNIKKGGHVMTHRVQMLPIIATQLKVKEVNRNTPNCKITGNNMRSRTTSAKQTKPSCVAFHYADNNLYLNSIIDGVSTVNWLYARDGNSQLGLSIPNNTTYIRVSKDYFIKALPKLCDVVDTGVLGFYMDKDPSWVMYNNNHHNIKPMEVTGKIGSMGEFVLYLLDINE